MEVLRKISNGRYNHNHKNSDDDDDDSSDSDDSESDDESNSDSDDDDDSYNDEIRPSVSNSNNIINNINVHYLVLNFDVNPQLVWMLQDRYHYEEVCMNYRSVLHGLKSKSIKIGLRPSRVSKGEIPKQE